MWRSGAEQQPRNALCSAALGGEVAVVASSIATRRLNFTGSLPNSPACGAGVLVLSSRVSGRRHRQNAVGGIAVSNTRRIKQTRTVFEKSATLD